MHIWNFFGAYFPMMPVMQLIHGVVLWAIIALTIYASNKSNVAINFTSHNDADELQMREFITKIKPSGENIIEKEKVNK